MKRLLTILFLFTVLLTEAQKRLPPLKISSNGRFFTAGKKPFFWLGDTGWLLFKKCKREEAIQYLETRKEQGFNVIQVMLLHELDVTNAYGTEALVNGDISKPNETKGWDYWDQVEFVIEEAEKRGIYIAMVPVWGSNVKAGKVTVQQAEQYALFLARYFKNATNIIWLNGGDIKGSDGLEVWQTIGATLRKKDPNHLITYHPRGRYSSSDWFHNEPWLDFNMSQSGHRTYEQDTSVADKHHYGEDNWKYIQVDYNLKPAKPALDGEPSYENIPHGLHDSLQPRWTDADLRRYAYWSVFAGGAGFTYGENAVMQFHTKGDKDANYGVNKNWKEAILSPGAQQMKHLIGLMLMQKSYFDRVPAQGILVDNTGERYNYQVATKGKKFAMVYTYTGSKIKVDLSKLGFKVKRISWYDPAKGERTNYETASANKVMEFTPPVRKENGKDWVLILE